MKSFLILRKEEGSDVKKKLSITLFIFLFIMLLSIVTVNAKLLDKASPKFANQMNNSLFNNSFMKENLHKDDVILWTPLENINVQNTTVMAWAIPSNNKGKEISNKKDLTQLYKKEIKAIGVVLLQELPKCKKIKKVVYSAPIKTNKRIGILSTKKDIKMNTIKKSIKSALVIKEKGLKPEDKDNKKWNFHLLKEK